MKIEDYNEYYIQGSDHYLIPKDNFKELFNEMVNWKENAQEYKEVIDKSIKYIEKNMNQKLYTGEEIFDTYSPATDLLNILEEME